MEPSPLLTRGGYGGTKSEVAYRTVRGLVLDGTIAPGSTVNQEGLALELGISITPLREALRRLQAEGLVQFEAHRTVVVAPLSAKELHDRFAVKNLLDPRAAHLAALTATDEQITALRKAAKVSNTASVAARLEANREFHSGLYDASNNAVLAEVCKQLWARSDRYRVIILREHRLTDARIVNQHLEIAEAIASRDARLASELAKAHTEEAEQAISESGQLT
jgi:DNA-binding GntR family transcriptional regulator